jgi:hypothetical protein
MHICIICVHAYIVGICSADLLGILTKSQQVSEISTVVTRL